jgi:hypothetical protein
LCFCFFSWFLWSSDFLELDITMVELVSLLLQFTASQKVSIYSIHYIDLDPLPGADQVNGDVAFECLWKCVWLLLLFKPSFGFCSLGWVALLLICWQSWNLDNLIIRSSCNSIQFDLNCK